MNYQVLETVQEFEGSTIRVVGTHDTPLFVLKDVCKILEIVNITNCAKRLSDSDKFAKKVKTISGYYDMITINQKALLKLTMKSNLEKAERFYAFMTEKYKQNIKNDDKEENIEPEYNLTINNYTLIYRKKDGFVDVTNLCKAGGKQYFDWNRLGKTKEFLKVLSFEMGIPVSNLIDSVSGGNCKQQGTWVHPQVAINIAQWISPEFDVQVSKWIFQLTLTGKVDIKEEKTSVELLKIQQELGQKIKELENTKQEVKELSSELTNEQNQVIKLKKSVLSHCKKFSFYQSFKELPAVYIISDPNRFNRSELKFGFTENINTRLASDRCMIPNLRLEFLMYTPFAREFENNIKLKFREKFVQLNHEWIVEPLEKLILFYRQLNKLLDLNGVEETECWKYNMDEKEIEVNTDEKEIVEVNTEIELNPVEKKEQHYVVCAKTEILSERLKKILPGWLLKYDYEQKNKNAPEGKRYCDGWCKKYLQSDDFRGSRYSLLAICKKCENMEDIAYIRLSSGQLTIDQIKSDPSILQCGENERICRQCKKTKKEEEFDTVNRKCRECKRENQKNRIKEINFKDTIEVLTIFTNDTSKTLYELKLKINTISKEELVLILKELNLGRLATDKKSDMCRKAYEYFEKLR